MGTALVKFFVKKNVFVRIRSHHVTVVTNITIITVVHERDRRHPRTPARRRRASTVTEGFGQVRDAIY